MPEPTFRDLVKIAVLEQFHDDFLVASEPLAESLLRVLHEHGYAVHRADRCAPILHRQRAVR